MSIVCVCLENVKPSLLFPLIPVMVTISEVRKEAMLPARRGWILVALNNVISDPPPPPDMFTRNQVNTPTNNPDKSQG